MPLIVTGTVGIDSVYTPHGHAEKVLGGSCTYFAAAASFYGPVRLVAAVGGDFDQQYRDVFKAFPNIDTAGLEVRPRSKTFAWGGKYHANMNSRETLYTELGVLTEPPPAIPAAYKGSEFVFLANTHPGVQLDLLGQFPQRRLAVADTMDLWINSARAELVALLKKVDGVVLNYDEAELFTRKNNPVTAARHMLADHGGTNGALKFVVVKKGEHGCLFVHKDGVAALPAYPAEQVVDPTGAGDTFAGGMMGYIAQQGAEGRLKNPASFEIVQQALAHGTVVASFNIESFTLSRLQTLKKGELDARLREFSKMVRV
ncbi:MAG: sugar kinase [Phycisphaeraceae bacterium]|nr:sugar kinase [Phycisphaeraceae bacterium]